MFHMFRAVERGEANGACLEKTTLEFPQCAMAAPMLIGGYKAWWAPGALRIADKSKAQGI